MFASIAGRYDLMNRVMTGGQDILWRRRVAKGDVGAGPVLDLCCGTGDIAFELARRHPGVRVVGADFTHEMLTIARRKAGGRSGAGAGVPFVDGDATALPFGDDTFTCVTVGFGLRNVADFGAGLREIARVLRPGGELRVLETSSVRNPAVAGLFRLYFRRVVPAVGRVLAANDHDAYTYLPESAAAFPDGEALCELMRAAGFADCSFRPLAFGATTFYTARTPA